MEIGAAKAGWLPRGDQTSLLVLLHCSQGLEKRVHPEETREIVVRVLQAGGTMPQRLDVAVAMTRATGNKA